MRGLQEPRAQADCSQHRQQLVAEDVMVQDSAARDDLARQDSRPIVIRKKGKAYSGRQRRSVRAGR